MARVKSGAFKARKGIPADVRDEYHATHGKRWEELFRAPPDREPQHAKALRGEWEAEIETRIVTIRAKQRGEGHDLTKKQAYALAGEWYRWFTTRYEDNPGSPDRWNDFLEILDTLVPKDYETRHRKDHNGITVAIVGIDWDELHKELPPLLTDEAKTAQFLASRGEVLTHVSVVTRVKHQKVPSESALHPAPEILVVRPRYREIGFESIA
jgi:hypothetical protein